MKYTCGLCLFFSSSDYEEDFEADNESSMEETTLQEMKSQDEETEACEVEEEENNGGRGTSSLDIINPDDPLTLSHLRHQNKLNILLDQPAKSP